MWDLSQKRPSFERLVAVSEQDLNLAAASLAIATDHYPELEPAQYLARLDEMAKAVAARLGPKPRQTETLSAINEHLFHDLGLSGNTRDYSDPRNSYLNEVLDRGLGIPISLSVIYLEVAWRLGLPCQGVSFPGHFLIKCRVHGGHVVLDPFNQGASLGGSELVALAARVLGHDALAGDALGQLLVAVPKRSILLRLLRNLKLIHLQADRPEQALMVLDKMLHLDPSSAVDLRDRGKIYEDMEATRAALADYRSYLALVPDGPDAAHLRARVVVLDRAVARLN